jgi:hypothetical protein
MLLVLAWLPLAVVTVVAQQPASGGDAKPTTAQQEPAKTPEPKKASPEVLPDAPSAKKGTDANGVPVKPKRIFGIVPNFKTVDDPHSQIAPINAKGKFRLVLDFFDPFTFVNTGFQAGLEQASNGKEGYGQGAAGYAKRYAADFADAGIGEFFVTGVFPTVLHEDPRYIRQAHGSLRSRTWHAVSRVLIIHSDSGKPTFNFSEVLGNMAGAGVANLYYPPEDREAMNVVTRTGVDMGYDAIGYLLREFYPDMAAKVFRKKAKVGEKQ